MIEEWRSIKDYEDYKVSNLGRVKSLKFGKEKILKKGLSGNGYHIVNLCDVGLVKARKVHQLVAVAFLNHKPDGYKLVVNHKDFNRTNNNVSNLEIVSARENSNRKHIKSTSKHVGIYWNKAASKWRAQIVINRKKKHLGYFVDEIQASNAYQKALKNIK